MSGNWKKLTNAPGFNASTMLLLTDGSVLCQQSGGVHWSRLIPDSSGSYLAGTWSPAAPMLNTRLYYASAVLRDGRVIVCGGEYSDAGSETNLCEIFDPTSDAWTALTPPSGWTEIGDAACCVLPDGRFLMGYLSGTKTAIFDPTSNAWSAGPNKGDSASEETWTLLGDNTVLCAQCSNAPYAEKYLAPANLWVSAGKVPVDLVEAASLEIGPACVMPDGRVFCVGATSHNALYKPPADPSRPGSWNAAPDFPQIGGKTIGAKDAPCCLLPNGKVLFVGGPVDGQADSYLAPTYFFEFDGTNISRAPDPPNSLGMPYQGRMLLLPTGQVLFSAETNAVYCYTPDGAPLDSWRPRITSAPNVIRPGGSYTLQGQQINGLSQAVGYGDDSSAATNYPIVQLRDPASGRVFYCRTFDHSTMGVATGAALHTTNFSVPGTVLQTSLELRVVANGIASLPVTVSVTNPSLRPPQLTEVWQWLFGSFADGPLWVWTKHGPVPVGPQWRTLVADEAKLARQQIRGGMRTLERLGAKVVRARAQAALKRPPAMDLEALGQADDDDGKVKTAAAKRAGKRARKKRH